MNLEKKKVICIVGPTASGKTALGIELAKKINGEIISADSMQIYKNLSIGTAKVTNEEACGIPHHMIDICNIDEKFSVADFKKMCYDKIDAIIENNNIPIIVGGTGLYVSSVVDNMNFDEHEIDYKYREELEKIAIENGKDYLYNMLKEVDLQSANVIHKNNTKRVIRALEIAKESSDLKSKHMENEKIRKETEDTKYDFYVFCINIDRDLLYKRINERVDKMINSGLVKEAKYVYDSNLDNSCTCMQAIGYKEFFPYFKNESSLDECIENLKRETRKYAKRQMTWFRNKLNCNYLDGTKSTLELVEEIISILT
jgi:tRNA dimethylallyltransferase